LLSLWLSFFTPIVHILATGVGQVADHFDYPVVSFLNGFAHRSWTLDTFIYLVEFNSFGTAPILVLFWWAWFKDKEDKPQNREFLLYGIIACFPAVFVSRIVSLALPFRERPFHNPLLHFQLPYDVRPGQLLGWSSFPSNHAAVWFTLAMSLVFVSRRAGAFLLVYVSCALCLARIYVGIHYPTDILAGALIGIGIAYSSKVLALRAMMTHQPLRWLQSAPGPFYACLFILTQQMTAGFDSSIEIYRFCHAMVHAIVKLV
jgi:undecaprenyl-diphosphatase